MRMVRRRWGVRHDPELAGADAFARIHGDLIRVSPKAGSAFMHFSASCVQNMLLDRSAVHDFAILSAGWWS